MIAFRRIAIGFLVLTLGAPAGLPQSAPATSDVAVSPAWAEVKLGVRRWLFFSGELSISRRQARYPGLGPHKGKLLTLIETISEAEAFGDKVSSVKTSSWIDPATGATVEFRELSEGKRRKEILFRADGFHEKVFRPEEGNKKASPESWPVTRDRFRPYVLKDGTPVPEGQPVRDYFNMIADLGRLDLQDVERADYYVATKGRVVRFAVEFKEAGSRKLALSDLEEGGELKMELRLRRLHLTPVDEDPRDVGSFFAMEGGTEIWVEEGTGILSLVAGKVPRVPGRTEILLRGARFDGLGLREALSPAAPAAATPTAAAPGSR